MLAYNHVTQFVTKNNFFYKVCNTNNNRYFKKCGGGKKATYVTCGKKKQCLTCFPGNCFLGMYVNLLNKWG